MRNLDSPTTCLRRYLSGLVTAFGNPVTRLLFKPQTQLNHNHQHRLSWLRESNLWYVTFLPANMESVLMLQQGVSRTNDFDTQLIVSSPLIAQEPSLNASAPISYAQSALHHLVNSLPSQSQENNSLQVGRLNTCECQDGSTKPKSQLLMTQDGIVSWTAALLSMIARLTAAVEMHCM